VGNTKFIVPLRRQQPCFMARLFPPGDTLMDHWSTVIEKV
jgi:hypothetical protein